MKKLPTKPLLIIRKAKYDPTFCEIYNNRTFFCAKQNLKLLNVFLDKYKTYLCDKNYCYFANVTDELYTQMNLDLPNYNLYVE